MLYSFLIYFFGSLIALFNGRMTVKHKENLPKGNYVIVAPHRTWMDPPLIALAVYPKKLIFMAKQELFKNKLAGKFISSLGAFPVDRKHPGASVIKTPVRELKKGDRSTIVFPTGSRYSTKMKGGALMIAKMAGVPIVPVVYQGPGEIKELFSRKKRRKVNIGKPIEIDKHQKLTDEYQAKVEAQLQETFDALDKELDPNFKYEVPKRPADDQVE